MGSAACGGAPDSPLSLPLCWAPAQGEDGRGREGGREDGDGRGRRTEDCGIEEDGAGGTALGGRPEERRVAEVMLGR